MKFARLILREPNPWLRRFQVAGFQLPSSAQAHVKRLAGQVEQAAHAEHAQADKPLVEYSQAPMVERVEQGALERAMASCEEPLAKQVDVVGLAVASRLAVVEHIEQPKDC